jgi:hypothetical protein
MHTMENEWLQVHVSEETGSISIHDRKSDTEWKQPTDEIMVRTGSGRILRRELQVRAVDRTESGLAVSAQIADVEGATLELHWRLELSENTLRLQLDTVKGLRPGQVLEMAWPNGLVSGESHEEGYLVLPIRTGQLLSFGAMRKPDTHEDLIYGGMKMALFGAVRGRGAVAATVRTPYDCCLRTEANIGDWYTVSPVWIIEEGRLNYPRELELVFLSDASYVEIAKAYRRRMIADGRFVTLREKAETSPYVESLAGAVSGERRSYSLNPDGEPERPSIRLFFEQAKE